MPGRGTAPQSGDALEREVVQIAQSLGLVVRRRVKVGRRLWGNIRRIDVVVRDERTGRSLGIECKFQRTQGTAEEKLPILIKDIEAWPIDGILVFHGEGFSSNMRGYLYSTGKAIDLADLRAWLSLYFGIPSP